MANKEHLDKLLKGIDDWNVWRQKKVDILPDLSEVDISEADYPKGNFTKTNFTGANFTKANFFEADFSEAKLSSTILREANLQEANLYKASLNKADLNEAKLNNAYLGSANLSEANLQKTSLGKSFLGNSNLSKANLSGADLSGANLQSSNIKDANLTGTILLGVNLSDTDLKKVNLEGMNLRKANLNKATLNEANLSEADLSGAKLQGSNLEDADLQNTNLSGTDLRRANLKKANLSGANLSGADLFKADCQDTNLSGAIVNEATLSKSPKIIGCKIGINGIWCKGTDSAALMALMPPGDSMKGHNPEAVVENLKRARRFNAFSLGLAALAILSKLPQLTNVFKEIRTPYTGNVPIAPETFILIALTFSALFLIMVRLFFYNALTGARYLQDRAATMQVGSFPWALSTYASEDREKIILFIVRFFMAFHPLCYLLYWKEFKLFYETNDLYLIYFAVMGFVILLHSAWIFKISQQFQKPILFDSKTEERRGSEIAEFISSIKNQNEKITELIDLLKMKEENKRE